MRRCLDRHDKDIKSISIGDFNFLLTHGDQRILCDLQFVTVNRIDVTLRRPNPYLQTGQIQAFTGGIDHLVGSAQYLYASHGGSFSVYSTRIKRL